MFRPWPQHLPAVDPEGRWGAGVISQPQGPGLTPIPALTPEHGHVETLRTVLSAP